MAQDSVELLVIENVTKTFDGRVTLNNVSAKLTTGQIMGLIGKSASGKNSVYEYLLEDETLALEPLIPWTTNQHGPYVQGDTRATMAGTEGSHLVTGSESRKPVSVRIGVCIMTGIFSSSFLIFLRTERPS